MLSITFWTLSAFLLIRLIIITAYRKKWNLLSIASGCFFACLALLLTPHAIHTFSLEPFAWTAAVLSSWLCYDLYHLKNGSFRFSKIRVLCGIAFSAFAVLLVFSLSLPHLFRSEVILHIQMTGEKKQEVVSWKTPSGPLMTQKVTSYRIKIKDMQDTVIFDDYLYGDLAAIRLKLINFPGWMQWIGFPTLWQPDAISSDYLSLERKKAGPSETILLCEKNKNARQKIIWGFWDKIFFYEGHSFFIHSCSLNSTHIPLLNRRGSPIQGSFVLQLSSDSKAPFIAKFEELNLTTK